MGAQVDRILRLWDETFEKESWHVPLIDAVRGLQAAQAAWKPAPERHSIWQIVEHLIFWKEYMLSRLRGAPRGPSGWAKGLDWKDVWETTDSAWEDTLRRLVEVQKALKAELGRRSDDDLDVPLPGSSFPLFTIQTMAVHDAYHCGQICYLRALQGIPVG